MAIIKLFGGPGVGKTYTLAQEVCKGRSMNLKQTDMLSLSFTQAAKIELIKECEEIWGREYIGYKNKGFKALNIKTIHSFAYHNILKPRVDMPDLYNLHQYIFRKHRWDDRFSAGISLLRRVAHDPELFDRTVERMYNQVIFRFRQPLQVGDILDAYQRYMDEKGERWDYDDCIAQALKLEPDPANRWEIVTVDECQDLSLAQWNLVRRHVTPFANKVWYAGDLSQAIYIWAGADPHIFKNEPADETITLTETHRIPKKILNTINVIQSTMKDRSLESEVVSNKVGGRIEFKSWANTLLDIKDISDDFSTDVLVLTIMNSTIRTMQDYMFREGILFVHMIESAYDPWTPSITESTWCTLRLVSLILDPEDDDGSPRQISLRDIKRGLKSSEYYSDLWKSYYGDIEQQIQDASHEERDQMERLTAFPVRNLLNVLGLDRGVDEEYLYRQFFSNQYTPPHEPEDTTMTKFRWMLRQYKDKCYQGPYVQPRVKLSTIHKAKGLQADTIVLYLTRAQIDHRPGLDDEKKLIINAMARTKRRLIITCPPQEAPHILQNHFASPSRIFSESVRQNIEFEFDEWKMH